ncbi:MAG: NAD-dependent epimerase/dehydratase family protein [Planctomycetota bacterium]|jgi:UDP-glucose 4-epimerase
MSVMSAASSRSCLVTGGAGFIGSHLVAHLAARGDRVTVVDDCSTGRRENLDGVDPARLTVLEATVSEALPRFEPGAFDEIYHLAAAVGVRLVIEQPVHTIETNVHETSALLNYAVTGGTPTLIASTSEVYGKSEKTPFAEDDDVVYGPTTLSRWSYACSKAIDEYLALACHRRHGLPVVIMRFFNTVGPGQLGRYGMVLPRFIQAALAGEPLQVYGDGRQTRCFCDVRDVVKTLPRMLVEPTCAGRVFNIGRDEPISIEALARRVIEVLGSPSTIVHVPYEQAFGEGFDDLRERRPDLTRIRAAVGFEPSIPLEQTIRDIAADLQRRAAPTMETPVR